MVNKIFGYFDLQSARRPSMPKGTSRESGWFPVWPQYLALVLGITIEPFLSRYVQSGSWSFSNLPGSLLFGVILGLAIFPGAYKGALDPAKPLFVQLCAIFSAGLGWQSLLSVGAKAALKIG